MHGVGQEPLGDRGWPHDLGCHTRRNTFVGQSSRGILGGEQLANVPCRVFQSGDHCVPAIHDDRAVGVARRLSRRARSNRSRRSTCSRVAPGFAPGRGLRVGLS